MTPPRCAIYARYSSENQREASIEDQLRICRARAEREGWEVVEVFTDAAISGATALRPGYQALLTSMRTGALDLVLTESLDRLSRDQEHIAGFYKHASFAGVRVVTLSEGEVSELHIGLKGTMGALYLKDLADKTRRGLEGRVRAGRGVGRVPYGYRPIRRLGPDGEPERGLREPDPAEAEVVRRIFRDYAAGRSPKAIARTLNAEGVPGPTGGPWLEGTIRGRAGRTFKAIGKDYLACTAAREGICTNRAYVRRGPLEARVCEALATRLMDPPLAAEFAEAFIAEWNRLAAEADAGAATRRDELREVERRIANLLDALAEGVRGAGVAERLAGLEGRKAELEAALTATQPAPPRLLPNIGEVYRRNVAALNEALAGEDASEAREAARTLIGRVVITPPGDGGGPPGIELVGDLAAMLRAAGVILPTASSGKEHADIADAALRSVKETQGGQRPPQFLPTPAAPRSTPPAAASAAGPARSAR